MYNYEKITQEQFEVLLKEIYKIAEDSKTIIISDFIRVVEKKILSLMREK